MESPSRLEIATRFGCGTLFLMSIGAYALWSFFDLSGRVLLITALGAGIAGGILAAVQGERLWSRWSSFWQYVRDFFVLRP